MKTKIVLIAALLLLITSCLTCGIALAEEEQTAPSTLVSFDDTNVLTDLADMTINGEPFSLDNYPQNANGTPGFLAFVEFSFSLKMEYQHLYGLYFYVYNPSGALIVDDPQYNNVEMVIKYNADGSVQEADKLQLKVVSKSADNIFYKLKVVERVAELYNRVAMTPHARKYDISSIELKHDGQINAKDYKIGGTWIFEGYAKGMAAESMEESTLASTWDSLTTLDLETHFTYYRTFNSKETADQLTTVYFSIDKTFDDQFDDLYSVQAECWKYLTSPMACVLDKHYAGYDPFAKYDNIYNDLLNQRGQSSGERALVWGKWPLDTPFCAYGTERKLYNQYLDILAWVLRVRSEEDFSVNTPALLQYMTNYSDGKAKTIRDKYSSDLFSDVYYDGDSTPFTSGYYPIDLNKSGEDDFSMVGSTVKQTIWTKFFKNKNWKDSWANISPIVKVTYEDVRYMNADEVSSTYFIATKDIETFKEYLRTQDGMVTYLFRFSVDTYYVSDMKTDYQINTESIFPVGYIAQEPAFLDFDIISVGYKKDGIVTIIPVVCDPQDFIAAVEPGQEIVDVSNVVSGIMVKFFTIFFAVLIIAAVVLVVLWSLKVVFFHR